MRPWLVVAILLPLAGCVTDAPNHPAPAFRLEGFVATYEEEGQPAWRLVLDGPAHRLGMDLVERPAYRLKAERLQGEGTWDHRDAAYFDGLGQLVRSDRCVEHLAPCYRWAVDWHGMFQPGWDIEGHGVFWPLSGSDSLERSWRGTTLVIRDTGPVFTGRCYEYEGERPVPIRSCDGAVRLVSYESRDLASVAAWPHASERIASGSSANGLFPGADKDLQGFGFTSLQALDALRANSPEVAAKLLAGGCVVTTLFGHGSGVFGNGLFGAFERPLANVSFTIQELDETRTKYTVTWVEDIASGSQRFSRSVRMNEPDLEDGPSCGGEAPPAWPAIGADEFLAAMSTRFGPPRPDGFMVTRQSVFQAPAPSLKYVYDGSQPGQPCWCGARMTLDADQGRMVSAQYVSDNDLEPEQNA